MYLIDKAESVPNILLSVVSETIPHLKRGAMRDFLNIMNESLHFEEKAWNRTDFIYSFKNGSKIEFFSSDNPGKVKGARRDILFVNEANNVTYDIYEQLEIRTESEIWLDWNPSSEFWFYEHLINRDDVDFLTLTYKDNSALSQNIVEAIEKRKNNKNWWLVYGLGQLGEVEGRIYTGWKIIDEIPHEARLERYGLDFGYSNDPTAICSLHYYNGGYIIDEILHRKGLSNKMIADTLNNQPQALVIADSAEPKSIEEISQYGVAIYPCTKGQGSVNQGINFVQSQKISITKRSINFIKSYRNYMWMTDKDGKIINTPDHHYSDAMDAVRYAFNSIAIEDDEEEINYKEVSYDPY